MIIETSSYGLCLFSVLSMNEFLKHKKKLRTKKILDLFQNDDELYLESLMKGIWLPIVNISSIGYQIKLIEKKEDYNFVYENFNLDISDDELWICDIGKLHKFNGSEFNNIDELFYYTLDNERITNGIKFPIKSGKYKVSIYESIENNIPCFSFSLLPVHDFNNYNDPREINFNF